jgi:hypothetical protein
MPLLSESALRFASTVSDLVHSNPFLPERFELEKAALGDEYRADEQPAWSLIPDSTIRLGNVERLIARVETCAQSMRDLLSAGQRGNTTELELYGDLVLHLLYYRHYGNWFSWTASDGPAFTPIRKAEWRSFMEDYLYWLGIEGVTIPGQADAPQTFAILHQVCRAFYNIYQCVVGQSLPSARLRAAIWESIFTFDMRRYRRCLYDRMQDIATLITGPSGTGKDLVAGAIGRSRYIEFNAETCQFAADPASSFLPLNLSALPPNLIESELFGHAAGAFTGATSAREGWLQKCDRYGSVFLDEIGELDASIQVKLLRLLQNRQFQRMGESKTHRFDGKFITATNRDLAAEIQAGRFRADFYYRLCSDVIRTPSLHEQLADAPEDLSRMVGFIVRRILQDGAEAEATTAHVENWIHSRLPHDYSWPGNVRELEQCVRNVIVHNAYHPAAQRGGQPGPLERIAADVTGCRLSIEELQSRYCTLAYWCHGSLEKAAQELRIDRRTVRARLDRALLDELRGQAAGKRQAPEE